MGGTGTLSSLQTSGHLAVTKFDVFTRGKAKSSKKNKRFI